MFVDFNILNQLGSPSINSNTFANRPSAGQVGRLFVSTDTFEIYRDTGTGWDLIGGPGSSTVTGSGAAGQVTYWTGTNSVGGENNLWWDAANNRLGINTSTPGVALDVHSAADVGVQLNGTGATPSILQQFLSAGVAQYEIGYNWNTDINYRRFSIYDTAGAKEVISIDQQSRYVGINYQYSTLSDQPAYTLDVSGSGRFTDSGYFATASGGVSIGQTALTAGYILDVLGASLLQGTVNNNIVKILNSDTTNGNGLLITSQGTASGKYAFSVRNNAESSTYLQVNTDTGKVGWIGFTTNTPLVPYHFAFRQGEGDPTTFTGERLRLQGNDNNGRSNFITIISGSNAYGGFYVGDNSNAEIGKIRYYNLNDSWEFHTNNTIKATLTSGGNFLIGTTTDNGEKLQVNGAAIFTDVLTNNTSVYLCQTSGNCGIGISTPASKLDVVGTDGIRTSENQTTSSFITLRGLASEGRISVSSYGSFQPMTFYTSGSERLRITTAGDLEATGSLKTGAPTTGTAATWKLGTRVAAVVALDATQYIEVEVGGTFYKLAIVT